MDQIQSVLQEIVTWEQEPCKELRVSLLGRTGRATKQIMLYGPTQVGKTTLLMNIMGVLPEKQATLAKILRGGATAGNSATSTAVTYNKWDKTAFGLSISNIDETPSEPEMLSETEFSARITALNEENRKARMSLTSKYKDVFHYYIPSTYFCPQEIEENIQYIDLPGFGEKNEFMRERADILIEKCASQVDGAIAVIKANNAVKINQEYYRFLSRTPQKRRIVVVSYAVKECVEVKKLVQGKTPKTEAEERALWLEISQKHQELIGKSLDGEDSDSEELLVFPVESEEYLKEFFPNIQGVFRHSRHFLRERVQQIPAKSTFAACEEALTLHIQNTQEKIQRTDERVQKKENSLSSFRKHLKRINDQIGKYTEDTSLKKELVEKSEVVQFFRTLIDNSRGNNLLSGFYVKNTRIDRLFNNANENQRVLVKEMIDRLEGWFKDCRQGREYAELRKRLLAAGTVIINKIDVSDLLKKRDGWLVPSFGTESQGYVDKYMSRTASRIRSEMRKIVSKWEADNIGELEEELSRNKKEKNALELTKRKAEYSIKELEAEILALENEKETALKQLEQFEIGRNNVRSIFVKHFFLKKAELTTRIAQAKTPSMKIALLVVLTTIYTNMKHHIEAEESRK